MGKTGQNPKIGQLWRPVAPQPYVVQQKVDDLGNFLAVGLQYGVNSMSLQCMPWPVACSWVRCLFDRFSISDFGEKWPQSENVRKCLYGIVFFATGHQTMFRNQFWWKSAVAKLPKGLLDYHTKKLGLYGTRPSPHFARNGPNAPKIPERCYPLKCPCIPKIDFSAPKVTGSYM